VFRFDPALTVYVHRDPVDFRGGLDRMLATIQHAMGCDPFSASAFVFCNRARTRLRIVLWDRSGFWMMMKRLEEERFAWPDDGAAVCRLDVEQLAWLLRGFDLKAMKGHRALTYRHAA
jgi:transposase